MAADQAGEQVENPPASSPPTVTRSHSHLKSLSIATSQASATATAPARKLFSRLASPFTPSQRSLSEYYIRPDEPHRHYVPGDKLKGAVILAVVKPIRITHLVVSLRGHARVFRHGSTDESDGSNPWSTARTLQGKRPRTLYGNGFASLFQDEVILCGEGRLETGIYEFKFELEFPDKGLPSSIDFERGTISYTITSTLTRPTTISPIASCDRKVRLVETVDIGPFQQPQCQTITLEPIRRHYMKDKARGLKYRERSGHERSGDTHATATAPVAPNEDQNTSGRASSDKTQEQPGSPASSEISGVSVASGHTSSIRTVSNLAVSQSSSNLLGLPSVKKTITATITLLRSGCLRGDRFPIKVHVNHTKPIKSLHGVIITLYRQGHIDSRPTPGVRAGKRPGEQQEVLCSKSRSGLRGLSLSSAGSSSTFRKDLSQTFAPIIIDPRTLTTEVKASVKVPEDAFPTISSVPGGIICFRYYVEVVLDLDGKLPEIETCLPRPGMVNTPSNLRNANRNSANVTDEGVESVLAALGGSIVDTDQVRREKSVVACLFEVLVGTMNSNGCKNRERSGASERQSEAGHDLRRGTDPAPPTMNRSNVGGNGHMNEGIVPEYGLGQHDHDSGMPRIGSPPTDVEDEQVDEKTRIRQAEQRLLPSAPPDGHQVHLGASTATVGPSAPTTSDLLQNSDRSSWNGLHQSQLSATPAEARDQLSDPHGSPSDPVDRSGVAEDKQELELHRLRAQASAPGDGESSADEPLEAGLTASPVLPSAPVITEVDENGGFEGYLSHLRAEQRSRSERNASGGEHLPRYER